MKQRQTRKRSRESVAGVPPTGRSRKGPVWVDPRTHPRPPAVVEAQRVAKDFTEIAALLELCKQGRIYDVERWIQAGKPLQLAFRDVPSYQQIETPLVLALESHQFGLTLLLLCNGYRTDLEPHSPLDIALQDRAGDYVDLLLAWGADPTAADPDAVLDTYQISMMERFWTLRCDLTRERSLAYYLSERTRNKPAYGWAKRHCDDPRVANALALALNEAVWENREKAVALLMWAGADSHRKVSTLRYSDDDDDPDNERNSAIERAVSFGHGRLLRYLKPNPDLDDFDELWGDVCDPESLDVLFDRCPPRDWSKAIERNISRMAWWFHSPDANKACLERIFEHHWGRLDTLEPRGCQDLRRDLLKIDYGSDFAWILERLAKPRHCDPKIFAELARTPAMKERMTRHGLGALLPAPSAKRTARRVVGPKQSRLKVRSPKEQHEEWLASLTPANRETFLSLVITRQQLYAEVWVDPVIKVAERYGVSDVAVAKWCSRMNVPRPGRGYWARKSAGRWVKQLPLPESRTGYEEYVHKPRPTEKRPKPPATVPGLDLFEKPIPVPELIGSEHSLIARTRRALTDAAVQERGILWSRGEGSLDLRICQPSTQRALRIANAIIQALERAGFAVEVAASPDVQGSPSAYRTHAVVQDERIQFSIAETTEKVERPPTDEERAEMRRNPWRIRGPFFEYVPTGNLSLQIEGDWGHERHRRTWSDGQQQRLEDHLHSFIRGLLISAEAHKSRRRAWEHRV
jgi:hypothetical protein